MLKQSSTAYHSQKQLLGNPDLPPSGLRGALSRSNPFFLKLF